MSNASIESDGPNRDFALGSLAWRAANPQFSNPANDQVILTAHDSAIAANHGYN